MKTDDDYLEHTWFPSIVVRILMLRECCRLAVERPLIFLVIPCGNSARPSEFPRHQSEGILYGFYLFNTTALK